MMGTFLVHILKSSACLALLYLCYRMLLSKETFHRFNRIALLSLPVLSLAIPFIEITIQAPSDVPIPFMTTLEETLLMTEMKAGNVLIETPKHLPWNTLILSVYAGGILFLLVRQVWSLGRMIYLLRTSQKEKMDKDITLYIHRKKVAPFSWMKLIAISEEDLEKNGKAILAHERAHILNRHSWDMLLAQVCVFLQWFNPAAWLWMDDLKTIHEYETDEWVIRHDMDARSYQLSLIERVVGTRRFTMANSFNHSLLTKRITMMNKKKSNQWARLKYLCVLPLSALVLVVFARPEVSNELEELKMKYSFLNEGLPTEFQMNKKWPYNSSFIGDLANDTIKQNSQSDSIKEEFKKTGKFDARKLASGSSTGTPLIIIDDEVKGTNPDIMNKMDQTTIRSILIYQNTHEKAKIYGDKAKDGVIMITTWDYTLKNNNK